MRISFGGLFALTILGSRGGEAMAQTPPPPPQNPAPAAAALAAAPKAEISNGVLKATVLKPDAEAGFYRATRFDWSGIVSSLKLGDQEYYGLWFDQMAPNVRDFVLYEGKLVAGPNTAALGPAEAFDPNDPPGFKVAAAGAPFLKIGVGLLKKPEGADAYNSFRLYDIVDGGAWKTTTARDRVTSTHTLSNAASGWGYVYAKAVRLVPGKPQMVIEHSLKNTGAKPIKTSTFNHNFLTLGGLPTGPGLTVEAPFDLTTRQPIRGDAARIEGKRLIFSRELADGQTAQAALEGFGPTAADHRFSVMNATGAGYSVTSDQPLSSLFFWSIRRTASAEPYITLAAAPGETVKWTTTYTYAAPKAGR